MKRTAAALTTLALMASPAFAQAADGDTPAPGTKTAPGQLCKGESKKKTRKGKGKSPFAACILGVKRARREARAEARAERRESRGQGRGQGNRTTATDEPAANRRNPAQLCAGQSRRKSATDPKSPYAACVSGAAKARNDEGEDS